MIDDNSEKEYSLYGLEPNCAYRVVIDIHFVMADLLSRDYAFGLGLKVRDKKTGDLFPVRSQDCIFMTDTDYDRILLKKKEWE